MRPRSLAEVAEIAIAEPRSFALACDEFCDAFYLMHPDRVLMQAAIDAPPRLVGSAREDAWIGAIGEHLALRWGLAPPNWTGRKEHFMLDQPIFAPRSEALQPFLIAESPPAFRSRLIFTVAEPLMRARFPLSAGEVRLPWPHNDPAAEEGAIRP
jgi:hypothetical protein